MSELELGLQSVGLLSVVREQAAALGVSLAQAIERGMQGLSGCTAKESVEQVERCMPGSAEWAELERRAEAYAGRPVTQDEVFLFKHFGTTNLSQVPKHMLDELEAEIDAGGQ